MRIFFPLKIICIINILVAVLTSVYNNCYYHYHFLKLFEHLSFQSQLIVIPRRENILQSFVICIQTRCVHTHPHVCVCVCVCVCGDYFTGPLFLYVSYYTSIFDFTKLTANTLEEGSPGGWDVQASACNAGDPGLIPGLGRSPGEGNGNPAHHSCQKKSMDREVLQSMKSQAVRRDLMTNTFTDLEKENPCCVLYPMLYHSTLKISLNP